MSKPKKRPERPAEEPTDESLGLVHCDWCREAELETFGTLDVTLEQHREACEELGCTHAMSRRGENL